MSIFIRKWKHALLIIVLSVYTAYAAGPLFWVSMMSLRTTSEIAHNPYGFPQEFHLEKFADAWVNSSYSVYFSNSVKVVLSAVAVVTLIGGMAAHCFARYRFPLRKIFYFTIPLTFCDSRIQ